MGRKNKNNEPRSDFFCEDCSKGSWILEEIDVEHNPFMIHCPHARWIPERQLTLRGQRACEHFNKKQL